MTDKEALKILKSAVTTKKYSYHQRIKAFQQVHTAWTLDDALAVAQMEIGSVDPKDPKRGWYVMQWVKEIRGILALIEDKGKADNVVVNNHYHAPE